MVDENGENYHYLEDENGVVLDEKVSFRYTFQLESYKACL
jgi:hypothetical protein